MAVECAWLDLGAEVVLSEIFDRERDIVLNGQHRGYLVVLKSTVPEQRVQLTYHQHWRAVDSEPLLAIGADIYGVVLVTDIFPTPPGDVPGDLAGVLPF